MIRTWQIMANPAWQRFRCESPRLPRRLCHRLRRAWSCHLGYSPAASVSAGDVTRIIPGSVLLMPRQNRDVVNICQELPHHAQPLVAKKIRLQILGPIFSLGSAKCIKADAALPPVSLGRVPGLH